MLEFVKCDKKMLKDNERRQVSTAYPVIKANDIFNGIMRFNGILRVN